MLDLSKATNEDFASLFSEKTSILVNNAGILKCNKDYLTQNPHHIQQMLDLNMLPYTLATKHALLHNSNIIHLSSVVADFSCPSLAVYSGTKAFNHIFIFAE